VGRQGFNSAGSLVSGQGITFISTFNRKFILDFNQNTIGGNPLYGILLKSLGFPLPVVANGRLDCPVECVFVPVIAAAAA
jgi:hypothetical protein